MTLPIKNRKHKLPTPIITNEKCYYGCSNIALYINHSGKLMCSISANSCPVNKKKNSIGLKTAYKNGRPISDFGGKQGSWKIGLTKETDIRIRNNANANKGKRRISNEEKLRKIIYIEQCQFNLIGVIEKIDGYDLLKKYGMYSRTKNKNGVVRDHIISINYGYKNNIDPKIISHPANCRFVSHKDNARKTHRCGLTIDELKAKIETWNKNNT